MAQYDYAALEVRAAAILDRFGVQGCRVLRSGAPAADPAAPWKPQPSNPVADVVIVANATAVSDNVGYRRGKASAPQALTQSAVGKMYMRGAQVQDTLPGDWVEVPKAGRDPERFYISRAESINPGGVSVIWELTLRS